MERYTKKICSIKSEHQILCLYQNGFLKSSRVEIELHLFIQLYISSLMPPKTLLNLQFENISYKDNHVFISQDMRGVLIYPIPNLQNPWLNFTNYNSGYIFPELRKLKRAALYGKLKKFMEITLEIPMVDFEDVRFFIKNYLIKKSNYKNTFIRRAFANRYSPLSELEMRDKQNLLTWWIGNLNSFGRFGYV